MFGARNNAGSIPVIPTMTIKTIKSVEYMPRHRGFPNRKEECLHDKCSACKGTGRKKDGTICVHMISCPCSRCNPTFSLDRGKVWC